MFDQTSRLTTVSAYLVYRLTSEHVIDRHTTSHYMPLIDIRSLEWSDRFVEHVAPLKLLPRLAWSVVEQPNGVSDDVFREAVTRITISRSEHAAAYRGRPSSARGSNKALSLALR